MSKFRRYERYKDSGIEWIGEIPEPWTVKRIKYISSMISKGTTPSTIGQQILDSGKIRI
ncbi:MAG: type restriction enzyme subunit [Candidatus Petromonas sp.]|jgi:type I restriction enzyme S subunit|nr:type restriction enzyme subunit [Candidatus Petromonas sp.]